MKVGIIQMATVFDKQANIDAAAREVAACAREGAQLAVLAEMFCCPYSNDYFASYAEEAVGPCWQSLSRMARENGIYLIGGSMPEREGERVHNTSFAFGPDGGQVARHRKMHLFDIDVEGGQSFKESLTFTPGGDITVFDAGGVKVGLCVCFDMRFPELSRLMALDGAQVIAVPAAFNMTTGPAHWELMFRQRAVDNQVYTLGVAPARDVGGVYVSYGNSMAVSPWGDVVFRAGHGAETRVVELDISKIDAVRRQLPLMSARRTDVYSVAKRE